MAFFKTRVFIATAFFCLGMATQWLWSHSRHWHFSWSSGPVVGHPSPRAMNRFEPFFGGNGFEEIRRMQEEMLRSFQQMEDDFPRGFQGGFSISSPDLTEDEDQYRLEIALQGLQPKNFNIQVEKNHLRLQGSLVREEGGGSISSSFSRTFPVPPDVDADRIQIENQKDRLVVILPKKKN